MRGVFLFWTLGFAVYQTARSTGAMRGQAKKKGKLFWGMFVLGDASRKFLDFNYLVYPVEAALADKLCGIAETHGGRASCAGRTRWVGQSVSGL